jgi:hypothetical protein
MAEQASVESIKELLALTEANKLIDKMFPQIETTIKSSLTQAGLNLPEERQRELEEISPKIASEFTQVIREELSWEKIEPIYLEIYQKSYTQEEVDGMLSFFKSPAGVAITKKMPLVMQETMVAMQKLMTPMLARVQKTAEKLVSDLEKEKE